MIIKVKTLVLSTETFTLCESYLVGNPKDRVSLDETQTRRTRKNSKVATMPKESLLRLHVLH